jgi:lipopolysaccharide/colanic/teichoic acid biosynthesis glycosyltransferase
MAAVWLLIKTTTKESPVFRQERLGLNCKPFVMYKFRTMKTADGSPAGWTTKNDPRRTRFGVWIRRLSIDELPQLFNIIKGEMSVVGPRPEIECFANRFMESVPRYMVKHQVKPGITGWAQIHGLRGDTSIEQRIKSDIYYIENWSLMLDVAILFHTVSKAFYNANE